VDADRDQFCIDVEGQSFDLLLIRLSGKVSMDNAETVRGALALAIEAQPLKNIVLDLAGVTYFDSSGTAILMEIRRLCGEQSNSLKLVNIPPAIQGLLDLADFERVKAADVLRPREDPRVLVQIGEGTLWFHDNVKQIFTFIGAAAVALWQDVRHPSTVRWDRVWTLIERSGADAVPISALLSFLMGGILAFQAAIQLRKFGANIFVADLVSLAICLEMGPLLTALIVSGRSGAAYAAHIGTMQVTEEVDALRVMAIDPVRFLVSPRILAVAFMLPCLTLFADFMGIIGGCAVAVLSLDVTPTAFFNQVEKVLELTDVAKGVLKSFVFGIEIALIGCMRGFQVRGGAESVGRATTSTVVTCIFVLTVTDAVFSLLYHYLPALWAF
jgi:phospholipid/cholesterol/gamma-HCH transport system permease protein